MHLPELNYKKIILVIGFFATSALFGWLIYIFFFRQLATPPASNVNEEIIPIDKSGGNINING